ncbi:MAG: tRNA (adenosine(37)-N6)-dimethylallyltransferase MiaA [Syntrophorhabdaceae bacterium]|nr:tRNA (adenosine(37)-N6)-dimethylallyltransferase MiaA [Syntrophorhabdaceae bacterium]
MSKGLLKILAVVGPTCSGKSELSMLLAKRLGGEIVNADSMQVYKYFDIGTAKPDTHAKKEIPHHLIDVVEPDQEFNAAIFKGMADSTIEEIHSRGLIPIVVGGTGLYFRTLVYGLFSAPGDINLRRELEERYREEPFGLYRELKRVDPEYATKISPNDRIRVVRALEVFMTTGSGMSVWERSHGFKERQYNAFAIGLTADRTTLYTKINKRVEDMLRAGWVDEVRHILSLGYNENIKPFSGIGYREILSYLRGEMEYGFMVEEIKRKTRHYAKRQFTWFSKERGINWYQFSTDLDKIISHVSEFLRDGN